MNDSHGGKALSKLNVDPSSSAIFQAKFGSLITFRSSAAARPTTWCFAPCCDTRSTISERVLGLRDLLWFIHLLGIALWLGPTTGGLLLLWPNGRQRDQGRDRKRDRKPPARIDVRTCVVLLTRTTHIGAGLAALGGTGLSLIEQPKSNLGLFWLASMQGFGVIAFVLSVFVLTRIGKKITRMEPNSEAERRVVRAYRNWLSVVWLLLMLSLILAAFKPI